MPGMNGTGPMGQGPRTGRGLGPCNRMGMGMGMGFGFRRFGNNCGRGLGRFFGCNCPQTVADQKEVMADYRKALEEELEDVKQEELELAKEE